MLTHTAAKIDVALTNFSRKIQQLDFVWEKLMPRVLVKKRCDKYYIYGENHFKLAETIRAPKTASLGSEPTYSTTTYDCKRRAWHSTYDDDDVSNADSVINIQQDCIEECNDVVNLSIEAAVAASLTSTSVLTNYKDMDGNGTDTCDGKWDDYTDANSDPRRALRIAKIAVRNASLKIPNTFLIEAEAAEYLADHPKMVNLMKYYRAKEMIEAGNPLPNELMGMKVVYAQAMYDTLKRGQTRTAFTPLWGHNGIVAYVDPNPGIKTNTLGVTFNYKGRLVLTWHDDAKDCDVIELNEMGLDHKVVNANCAYLLTNLIK